MRTLSYTSPPENTFFTLDFDNIRHRYSSIKFQYEKWNEPKLSVVRDRLKIDDVIKGASTDFEIINRVRHHVSQQWHHGH